jgi:YhgE/Pip-like protein
MSDGGSGSEQVRGAPAVRPAALLRVRAIWLGPALIAGVLIVLMALAYIGSVINPTGHLHGLPVLIVNEDGGEQPAGAHTNFGQSVASELEKSPAVSSRLSLRSVTMAEADARMNRGGAYATIVIPRNFTASLVELYTGKTIDRKAPGLPTIRILTNGLAGNIGVDLATGVADPAIAKIVAAIRPRLAALSSSSAPPVPAIAALRANPVTVVAVPYRALPPHSALGLSAFYVSLLTLMCGFLGATIVNSAVDGALGYAPTEVGPRWRSRLPVSISRWHTLATKWTIAASIAPVLTGLMLIVAIGPLHMNAPHPAQLWLFASFAAIVVAIGTLTLIAAFGSLGQLLAILVFIYLALASSGGTTPLQALPGPLRLLANVEPLRQIIGGVRSILYFGAAGDAGLSRGLLLTTIGLVIGLLAGFVVTKTYDRKGLSRIEPELVAYITRSARDYTDRERPTTTG